MRKKLFLTHILLVLSVSFLIAQEQFTIDQFKDYCESSGLNFQMPDGYKVIDVKENSDLGYSFAVINSEATMEIRYTIWPLNSALKEYEASLKDKSRTMVHPNNFYKGTIQANVLNMTCLLYTSPSPRDRG